MLREAVSIWDQAITELGAYRQYWSSLRMDDGVILHKERLIIQGSLRQEVLASL